MTSKLRFLLMLTLSLALSACNDGSREFDIAPIPERPAPPPPPNPFEGYSSTQYADLDNWLCHASLDAADNTCAGELDATVVNSDGSTSIEPHQAAEDPPIDCFYVYPTVSGDASGNADLEAGEEERFTVLNQAARYSRLCRLYAPVYRQVTVAALFTDVEGDRELAYGDVLDAFKHYIANDNDGRGFILIGHSQGSFHLRSLIAEQVETDDYLSQRMVSAHLIGATVEIPVGADVGGSFQAVPVCRSADQVGCVVSYASFRADDPFLAAGEARFGQPGENTRAVCVNPAAPAGGKAALRPYTASGSVGALDAVLIRRVDGPFADPAANAALTTPFYTMPDFVYGECKVNEDGVSYLEIAVDADPQDPRADDINGEFIIGPGWGLHLVDMNLAMGDLVDLAETQAAAWLDEQ